MNNLLKQKSGFNWASAVAFLAWGILTYFIGLAQSDSHSHSLKIIEKEKLNFVKRHRRISSLKNPHTLTRQQREAKLKNITLELNNITENKNPFLLGIEYWDIIKKLDSNELVEIYSEGNIWNDFIWMRLGEIDVQKGIELLDTAGDKEKQSAMYIFLHSWCSQDLIGAFEFVVDNNLDHPYVYSKAFKSMTLYNLEKTYTKMLNLEGKSKKYAFEGIIEALDNPRDIEKVILKLNDDRESFNLTRTALKKWMSLAPLDGMEWAMALEEVKRDRALPIAWHFWMSNDPATAANWKLQMSTNTTDDTNEIIDSWPSNDLEGIIIFLDSSELNEKNDEELIGWASFREPEDAFKIALRIQNEEKRMEQLFRAIDKMDGSQSEIAELIESSKNLTFEDKEKLKAQMEKHF